MSEGPADAGGGFGRFFGPDSIARQFLIWGVLQQIAQAVLSPVMVEVTQEISKLAPLVALSPQELAVLVNRGFRAAEDAAGEAAESGIDADRFAQLVDLAGDAPPPAVIAEGVRRGILSWDAAQGGMPSGRDGIRQGNLRDVWAPLIEQLTVQIPSVAEVMNAWLEGQIGEAEARRRYTEAGGDPTWFQTSFNTNGSSPTPDMLGTMANRGIIPWDGTGPAATTFQQGFLEGPWRNKWEPAMRALQEYLPPPRTVTALQRAGAITAAQALQLYQQQGLSAELAAAYVKDASQSTSSAAKSLTEAQIVSLYEGGVIGAPEASQMLGQLGYPAADAKLLVSAADVRKTTAATNSAITRIRSLYTGRKITKAASVAALNGLGVPSSQSGELLQIWDLEAAASVKALSEGQIASALFYKVIDQTEAMALLEAIGYTPRDAWIILSVRMHAPLPNPPAPGPGPVSVT